jgi:anti-sigma regulatory factor (Ser/Thr protein kinase)
MNSVDNNVDRIEMSFPARKEYARLLRLVASGIASRMDFSFDGLDDLKIGLEETFVFAMNDSSRERFDIVFEIYSDRLEVLVTGLETIEDLEDQMSSKFGFSILDSVMDKIEWINTGDSSRLKLVKQIC